MRKPPEAALAQLRKWGHIVDNWKYRDEWWVGYSTTAICTVSEITGKLIVEVCARIHYAEINT